jgi:hypothetical protein
MKQGPFGFYAVRPSTLSKIIGVRKDRKLWKTSLASTNLSVE